MLVAVSHGLITQQNKAKFTFLLWKNYMFQKTSLGPLVQFSDLQPGCHGALECCEMLFRVMCSISTPRHANTYVIHKINLEISNRNP